MKGRMMLTIVFSLTMGVFSFSHAAESLLLQDISYSELENSFYLAWSAPPKTIHTPTDMLQHVGEHTDEKGITHARFQQQYHGYPVFGGYAILHGKKLSSRALGAVDNCSITRSTPISRSMSAKSMPPEDTPRDAGIDLKCQQTLSVNQTTFSMNGLIYRELTTELGDPPVLFEKQALDALKHFKRNYVHATIQEEHVTPMVYVDENHQAVWAYQVSLLITSPSDMPERPTAIIKAFSFEPITEWNDLKSIKQSVAGIGYGGNTHTGKYQYGIDRPFLTLTRDDTQQMCLMENAHVKVVDMQHSYRDDRVNSMRFLCHAVISQGTNAYWTGYQEDGYDLQNGAYSPSNDALFAGEMIEQMYREWLGTPVLHHADEKPMQLVMRVHYGKAFENAFWDGHYMTFGDGDLLMHPLVSLGVASHEISHGFTEQHANLIYFGQSGGLNESFSDLAAQASEYFVYKNNNWLIGGEVLKSVKRNAALRFMEHPAQDGYSIERADQYRRNMDVHHSSGVYNRFFYLLSHQPGWNVEKTFRVMAKANMDYWTPFVNFDDAACGILHAAKDLAYPIDPIKQSLSEVAISCNSCPNVS